MLYYKIIDADKFIGVGTSIDLRRYQKKHGILLSCDESCAQYIQCNDVVYRATWMLPEVYKLDGIKIVDVIEIKQGEYEVLFEAVKTNKEIDIAKEPVVTEVVETADDGSVEYVRSTKIADMKRVCNEKIVAGFDIVLSDNKSYHFSLTTQDQLNLVTCQQLIASGEKTVAYHADGEVCRYYTAADMRAIIKKANTFKTYHIAYFNSLREYIKSLRSMNKISAIKYGDNMPEKYQSDVYAALKNEF